MLHTQVFHYDLSVVDTYTSRETEVNGCWSIKSTHLVVKDADPTYQKYTTQVTTHQAHGRCNKYLTHLVVKDADSTYQKEAIVMKGNSYISHDGICRQL